MTLKKPLGIFLAFCLFTGSAFGAAFQFGGLRLDKLTVTSSSSTVVLTKAHKQVNISQGSSNQVYNLPDATTLQAGYFYTFINESSGTLTINNSSSTVITTLAGTSTGAADALSATLYVTSTATTGGPWSVSKGGSSGSGTGSSLTKSYNITSHGFAVNDVVYCTATTTCAKASAAANNDAADPIGIVTAADANNFTVSYAGYASTLTGKTANTVYALSNTTAGLLVVDGSETCTTGTVHRVMLKTDSTTSGWVSNAPGTVCTGAVANTNQVRNIYLAFGGATEATDNSVCTSTCTIYRNYDSDGNTDYTLTRDATGKYHVGATAGRCSQPISCTVSPTEGGAGRIVDNASASAAPTTTTFKFGILNLSAAYVDSRATLTCMCLR